MLSRRSVRDVVEVLRAGKAAGKEGVFLVGAGCSASAGIPLADGLVRRIARDFPSHYARALPPTYANCMEQLGEGIRRELIRGYIDRAKINWAHIAIAQMMKAGYIAKVLTTNFDPLLMRACALVGVYPAVYDLAAAPTFVHHLAASPSILHLHGQHSGFVLLNTEDALHSHAQALQPVFDAIGGGVPWVIIGYSGANDPVFDRLAAIPRFEFEAFWATYHDDSPAHHVEKFLMGHPSAHLVQGYDADTFCVELARELGCFPPEFLGSPFAHLTALLDQIASWPFETHLMGHAVPEESVDFLNAARGLIAAASRQFEEGKRVRKGTVPSGRGLRAAYFLLSGDFRRAIEIAPHKTLDPAVEAVASRALAGRAAEILTNYQPAPADSSNEVRDLLKKARVRDSSNSYAKYLQGVVAALDAEHSDDPVLKLERFREAHRHFKASREFIDQWPPAYGMWGSSLQKLAGLHDAAGSKDEAARVIRELDKVQSAFAGALEAHEAVEPGIGMKYVEMMKPEALENPEIQEFLKRPPLALRVARPRPTSTERPLARGQLRLPVLDAADAPRKD